MYVHYRSIIKRNLCFDAFTEEYLEWGKTNKKPLTVLRNRKAANVLVPFFGAKKLNEITPQGKPWTSDSLSAAIKYAGRKAGLGSFGPHVLRHTFASRLVMAGVDLRTVQELMGHKSIGMTMRYAHISPNHTRAAMETLEQRFSAKSPADFHNTPHNTPSPMEQKVAAFR